MTFFFGHPRSRALEATEGTAQVPPATGAHHNIVGTTATSLFDLGRRLAITNHLIEDNPKNDKIAPENADVGIPLQPATPLTVNVHSINVTDRPALRETWISFGTAIRANSKSRWKERIVTSCVRPRQSRAPWDSPDDDESRHTANLR